MPDADRQSSPLPPSFPRPSPARATVRPRIELPDYLPARMLNEFVYCPRLFFYEWVDGVFTHSADTVDGAMRHERQETRGTGAMPAPGESASERIHARSVTLSSETHRLIATIDLVEGTGETVAPVDYKRGAPRRGEDGPDAWPADRAQVCVQALVLRDNGFVCNEALVYYHETKQRVRVPISDALVTETLAALADARTVAERGRIPPPLIDSPKCPRCSLVSVCLPDETAAAMSWHEDDEDDEQLHLFPLADGDERRPLVGGDRESSEIRRLVPARDDLRPLYIVGQGLSVGKSGEVLQVKARRQVVQEARVREVSQVNLFGNVQLTAAALQGLCWAGKPIAHFSSGAWFYGLTEGLGLKNVFLRREQFRRAEQPAFCLTVARQMVTTKIRNQRTLLQRNHVEPPVRTLDLLKRLARTATRAADAEALLGIEGSAARLYFEQFAGMIKAGDGDVSVFDFSRRNRRPPRDPINALLSLAYSLLTRDFTIVCRAIGFDPFIGFYHQPRFGRPALALDLMEGFRPLVADSAVLTAVNTRMVSSEDFISAAGAVSLTSNGRKAFIRAYEQRMDQLVTHPGFGYRVSYRRVLEIQARLLARVVAGELPMYTGFETR